MCGKLTRHNIQAPIDDVVTVKTTVESINDRTVVFVGEIASCDPSKKLIFKKLGREGRKDQIYSVPQIAANTILKITIMFVHAVTRCDSILALFFKGKTHLWELIRQLSEQQAIVVTFKLTMASSDLIFHSGFSAFLIM